MELHSSLLLNTSTLINFATVFSMEITSHPVKVYTKKDKFYYRSFEDFVELSTGNVITINTNLYRDKDRQTRDRYQRIQHHHYNTTSQNKEFEERHTSEMEEIQAEFNKEQLKASKFILTSSQPLYQHTILIKSSSNTETISFYSQQEMTQIEIIHHLQDTISIPKERHEIHRLSLNRTIPHSN